jgi:predicted dehydrogenase
VDNRDLGDLRYIAARRLNLGLFQKDINVAWDLAPHDISIILHIMQELPHSVNCRGGASITSGVEDMTSMSLQFTKERSAIIHSSWHDPRKVREMTIVGSKRMIVYDDIAPLEKIKVYDVRVERPPHYNTFAEFQYAYHYGDTYSPYIKHDEPLKTECQHFIDCINDGSVPLTSGATGLEVVRILEASSKSLKQQGAPVALWGGSTSPFPITHHRAAGSPGRSTPAPNGVAPSTVGSRTDGGLPVGVAPPAGGASPGDAEQNGTAHSAARHPPS